MALGGNIRSMLSAFPTEKQVLHKMDGSTAIDLQLKLVLPHLLVFRMDNL